MCPLCGFLLYDHGECLFVIGGQVNMNILKQQQRHCAGELTPGLNVFTSCIKLLANIVIVVMICHQVAPTVESAYYV